MITYNITLLISSDVHQTLRSWIINDYFPQLVENRSLRSPRFSQILDAPNDDKTYCLQVTFSQDNQLIAFKENEYLLLRKKVNTDFPEKVWMFESTMKKIL